MSSTKLGRELLGVRPAPAAQSPRTVNASPRVARSPSPSGVPAPSKRRGLRLLTGKAESSNVKAPLPSPMRTPVRSEPPAQAPRRCAWHGLAVVGGCAFLLITPPVYTVAGPTIAVDTCSMLPATSASTRRLQLIARIPSDTCTTMSTSTGGAACNPVSNPASIPAAMPVFSRAPRQHAELRQRLPHQSPPPLWRHQIV